MENKKNNLNKSTDANVQERKIKWGLIRSTEKLILKNNTIIHYLVSTPLNTLMKNNQFADYIRNADPIIECDDVEKIYKSLYKSGNYKEMYEGDFGRLRYLLIQLMEWNAFEVKQENIEWLSNRAIKTYEILFDILNYLKNYSNERDNKKKAVKELLLNTFMESIDLNTELVDKYILVEDIFMSKENIFYYFDAIGQ